MSRQRPINNPEKAEASRQTWERFTWLSVSKECRNRGHYPATNAYDDKGLLKESACPSLYREVHAYYGQQTAYYGAIDAMPVLSLRYGVVTIEWASAQQHERQQRIADSSS